MITSEIIESAKSKVKYDLEAHHEHDDCIRIAYEWLSAQKIIKNRTSKTYALKHLIEDWAGRYVSSSDVEVAAYLHPDIHGEYPHYNLSARLTEPSTDRLNSIQEANKHSYRNDHNSSNYTYHE